MANLLNYKVYLEIGLQLLGSLSIVATILVRLVPSDAANKYLAKFVYLLNKLLAWAPTLGLNPNTQKLLELQKELDKKP